MVLPGALRMLVAVWGDAGVNQRAASPSARRLRSAFRPASSFSPGSKRSPLSCLLRQENI